MDERGVQATEAEAVDDGQIVGLASLTSAIHYLSIGPLAVVQKKLEEVRVGC